MSDPAAPILPIVHHAGNDRDRSKSPHGSGDTQQRQPDCWDEDCDGSQVDPDDLLDDRRKLESHETGFVMLLEDAAACRRSCFHLIVKKACEIWESKLITYGFSISAAVRPAVYDLTWPCIQLHTDFDALCKICNVRHGQILGRPVMSMHFISIQAQEGKAAWSAALIGHGGLHDTALLEASGANLETDAWMSFAAHQADALHSEQFGILWVMLWVLQWMGTNRISCDFEFLFDNIAAGYGASGANSMPGERELTKIIRGVHGISFTHIHGHSSHPWNELADTLARSLMKRPWTPSARPPEHIAGLAKCVDWQWCWMGFTVHSRTQYTGWTHMGTPTRNLQSEAGAADPTW